VQNIYYNAKNLPKSVTKRKQEFKNEELVEKKENEISRRTQRLRDVSEFRKTAISKRKTTSTDEYGINIIKKDTNEDIGEFLRRANIDTRTQSNRSRSVGKRRKRRTRKNRKYVL
jgi:hypothetical protein